MYSKYLRCRLTVLYPQVEEKSHHVDSIDILLKRRACHKLDSKFIGDRPRLISLLTSLFYTNLGEFTFTHLRNQRCAFI